jgi:hypothetical protein
MERTAWRQLANAKPHAPAMIRLNAAARSQTWYVFLSEREKNYFIFELLLMSDIFVSRAKRLCKPLVHQQRRASLAKPSPSTRTVLRIRLDTLVSVVIAFKSSRLNSPLITFPLLF